MYEYCIFSHISEYSNEFSVEWNEREKERYYIQKYLWWPPMDTPSVNITLIEVFDFFFLHFNIPKFSGCEAVLKPYVFLLNVCAFFLKWQHDNWIETYFNTDSKFQQKLLIFWIFFLSKTILRNNFFTGQIDHFTGIFFYWALNLITWQKQEITELNRHWTVNNEHFHYKIKYNWGNHESL